MKCYCQPCFIICVCFNSFLHGSYSKWHFVDWSHTAGADSRGGVFDGVERLVSFPHMGGMLHIARGYKTTYLLHLIWTHISFQVLSIKGCVGVFLSCRNSFSVWIVSICLRLILPELTLFCVVLMSGVAAYEFWYAFPCSCSLPASLCQCWASFNEWAPLLLGLGACLQLWMKLSGVFGMAPIFGLSF